MKLVLSIAYDAGDDQTILTRIYDQTGQVIGIMNADNGKAILDIGQNHVVYVGPHPEEATDAQPAATLHAGLAPTPPEPAIAAAIVEPVVAAPAPVPDVAAQAQLAALEQQIAALTQQKAALAQPAPIPPVALPAGESVSDALKVEGVGFLEQLGAGLLSKL